MTSRRGFIAQLAALVAAGSAAPAMLAQLRPSSRAHVDGWNVKNTFEQTFAPRELAPMRTWILERVGGPGVLGVIAQGPMTRLSDGRYEMSGTPALTTGEYRYSFG